MADEKKLKIHSALLCSVLINIRQAKAFHRRFNILRFLPVDEDVGKGKKRAKQMFAIVGRLNSFIDTRGESKKRLINFQLFALPSGELV